ncbi:hypothetical protein ACFQ4C_06745 [Larkinella insperata]|uniref:DUF3823 domain-containing protein n=1 Tax=Larkinella insperata TaxID=332158 RepID=A0ABW3Q6L5_9BACT
MKAIRAVTAVLFIALMAGCNKDRDIDLPDYLVMPSSLANYKGSGRITINGGITLAAQGREQVQDGGTVSGVGASASAGDEVWMYATFNQPRTYEQSSMVPAEHRSNATLTIMRTINKGSYPMGLMSPNPRGEIADLVLNLPGPVTYITNAGSLTIEQSTLVRQEGSSSLYRIQGTFDASLTGYGSNVSNKNPQVTGTFDVFAVAN